ncbi:nitroreductase, partial [Nocardia seriolae]|nr:nitroreductase [Nocardia seriolae]
MSRIRVAACGVLFFDDAKLVWDDYVHHRQFALTPDSEEVLRWFAHWRELDSADQLGERHRAIAVRLLENGILIGEHSAEDTAERHLLAEWQAWGPAARYHHFAARTPADTRYAAVWEDEAYFEAKAEHVPAPEPAKSYPDRPRIPLARTVPDDDGWPRPRLVDALAARRSVRQFTDGEIPLDTAGFIARMGGGTTLVEEHPRLGPVLFKASPSAGARNPLVMAASAGAQPPP